MSGEPFKCGYGAIVNEDVEVLEWCLAQCTFTKKPLMVLEIGMHDGGTARGIATYLTISQRELIYYGIDPDDGTHRPRYVPEGGHVIIGDSAEVYDQVPDGLDLVWVDGCHCFNHVVLDTMHYAPKVRAGGFICYHDINPVGQGEKEHQYHGPLTADFGLAVRAALKALRPWFVDNGFIQVAEKYPTDIPNCGTIAYQRR